MQTAFVQDVKSPKKVIEQMGNPFSENSDNLLVWDSADSAVTDTMQHIERLQYVTYVNERLIEQTVPITDPIKRATSVSSAGLQSKRNHRDNYN